MPLWKQHQQAEPPAVVHPPSPSLFTAPGAPQPFLPTAIPSHPSVEQAVLTREVVFRGEIMGTDALYIDGDVEGIIHISHERVTIGPNGRVHAPAGHRGSSITARDVVVLGTVVGAIYADEKVEIRCNGSVSGEVSTMRVSIEDGALFRGSIDIRKPADLPAADLPAAHETLAKEMPDSIVAPIVEMAAAGI